MLIVYDSRSMGDVSRERGPDFVHFQKGSIRSGPVPDVRGRQDGPFSIQDARAVVCDALIPRKGFGLG
jgi:hypothetical protein